MTSIEKTGQESLERKENRMDSTTSVQRQLDEQQIASGLKQQWNGPKFQVKREIPSSGRKDDQDKTRVDLLDAEFLEDVGRVLKHGAQKYSQGKVSGEHNWRGGIAYSRLIGAAMRHLLAICRNEDIDPESGLPHSAHLGCSVMFLHFMLQNRPDLDDRWKNMPNSLGTTEDND